MWMLVEETTPVSEEIRAGLSNLEPQSDECEMVSEKESPGGDDPGGSFASGAVG
jgi:hypothetical protein